MKYHPLLISVFCLVSLCFSCKNTKRQVINNHDTPITEICKNTSNQTTHTLTHHPAREKPWKLPRSWKKHILESGRCSIYLPPNLKENTFDGGTYIHPEQGTTFFNNDSITKQHYYCRIAFDYFRGVPGTFYKHGDSKFIEESSFKKYMKLVAFDILGYEYADSLIEGPIYSYKYNEPYNKGACLGRDLYYEAYYKRKGIEYENGPMLVHIFIFQDNTDKVQITMSHYEKDSIVFKDIFRAVKTFRWH